MLKHSLGSSELWRTLGWVESSSFNSIYSTRVSVSAVTDVPSRLPDSAHWVRDAGHLTSLSPSPLYIQCLPSIKNSSNESDIRYTGFSFSSFQSQGCFRTYCVQLLGGTVQASLSTALGFAFIVQLSHPLTWPRKYITDFLLANSDIPFNMLSDSHFKEVSIFGFVVAGTIYFMVTPFGMDIKCVITRGIGPKKIMKNR